MERCGFAGRISRAFIDSKLTPLIVLASLLLGLLAVRMTPREEEPQIVVPMVDIYLPLPGATPAEVQERVVKPFEASLWEVKGVEYLYSMSRPGMGIITVRFLVGQPMEASLVKLYNKVMSTRPQLPPGAGEPLVSPRSIDDVPILCLTLWSSHYDHADLRRVALEVADELRKSPDTAETLVTGGQARQMRVTLDPARLAGYGISPLQVAAALERGNRNLASGSFSRSNRELLVEGGAFLDGGDAVRRVVVGIQGTQPVYLSDVATVTDGVKEPDDYLFLGLGPAAAERGLKGNPRQDYPAVTISVAKRTGANATRVADDLAAVRVAGPTGSVPLSQLLRVRETTGDKSLYR